MHTNSVDTDMKDYHSVGDRLHRNIDRSFRELANIFAIADDMYVVHYDKDSTDHDGTLHRVLTVCRKLRSKHR